MVWTADLLDLNADGKAFGLDLVVTEVEAVSEIGKHQSIEQAMLEQTSHTFILRPTQFAGQHSRKISNRVI